MRRTPQPPRRLDILDFLSATHSTRQTTPSPLKAKGAHRTRANKEKQLNYSKQKQTKKGHKPSNFRGGFIPNFVALRGTPRVLVADDRRLDRQYNMVYTTR